jgi:hypothetical protein
MTCELLTAPTPLAGLPPVQTGARQHTIVLAGGGASGPELGTPEQDRSHPN